MNMSTNIELLPLRVSQLCTKLVTKPVNKMTKIRHKGTIFVKLSFIRAFRRSF